MKKWLWGVVFAALALGLIQEMNLSIYDSGKITEQAHLKGQH